MKSLHLVETKVALEADQLYTVHTHDIDKIYPKPAAQTIRPWPDELGLLNMGVKAT